MRGGGVSMDPFLPLCLSILVVVVVSGGQLYDPGCPGWWDFVPIASPAYHSLGSLLVKLRNLAGSAAPQNETISSQDGSGPCLNDHYTLHEPQKPPFFPSLATLPPRGMASEQTLAVGRVPHSGRLFTQLTACLSLAKL